MAGLTIEAARAAFDRRRTAWLAEDLDGYMDCWADDMVIDVPGRTITGKAAYRELAAGSFTWARPVDFEFHHLAVDGDVVLCEFSGAGERPDGTRFAWDGMGRGVLRDGLIAEWREYWDPADFQR